MSKKRRFRVLLRGTAPKRPERLAFRRDGTVDILVDGKPVAIDNMRLEIFYDRGKKPKILNRAELPSNKITFDNLQTFASLDGLLAVDTGTRNIHGSRLSVGCLFYSAIEREGERLKATWGPRMFVAIRNAKISPERLAAAHLLALIARIPELASQRLGIVIDFDLDRLEMLNRREATLVESISLPASWRFMYATADAGAEFPTNRLIQKVDREGARLFQRLSECADIDEHVPSVRSELCDGLSVWLVQSEYLLPIDTAF